MANVEVNYPELMKSFHRLRKHSQDLYTPVQRETSSCCLLDALYAAECGIAAIILRENNYASTKEIMQKTHDIRIMLTKCVSAPAHRLPSQLPVKPLKNVRGKHILFSSLHSALRYGATLHERERQQCAREIEKLITWIDGNLRGR